MRISKIIFSVAAATTAFLGISAASAADMPAYSKAPVLAPAPVYNWAGFYVGGNVGYSWDNTAAAFSGNSLTSIFFAANIFPTAIGLNTNGVLAGGQFGYNWQVSPMWVRSMPPSSPPIAGPRMNAAPILPNIVARRSGGVTSAM